MEAINFILNISLSISHKFWHVVFSSSFCLKYFMIFCMISVVDYILFKDRLFSISKYFIFLDILLFFISNLILLWSEYTLHKITVHSNGLRTCFMTQNLVSFVLMNVSHILEKNVHSFECNVTKMSGQSGSIVFRSYMS